MLKKALSVLFLCIMMISALPQITAAADNVIRITVDGKRVETEAPPIIVDGRTLIPARAVFEAMGATVGWNSEEQSVSVVRGGTNIKIRIGGYYLHKNGEWTLMEIAPALINGRTMVPVRAVSEAMGANVEWDGADNTVVIESSSAPVSAGPETNRFIKTVNVIDAAPGKEGRRSIGLTKDGALYMWGDDTYYYQTASAQLLGMHTDMEGTHAVYETPQKIIENVADFVPSSTEVRNYAPYTVLLMKDGTVLLATGGVYAERYHTQSANQLTGVSFQYTSTISNLMLIPVAKSGKALYCNASGVLVLLNDGSLLVFNSESPSPARSVADDSISFSPDTVITDVERVYEDEYSRYILKRDGSLYRSDTSITGDVADVSGGIILKRDGRLYGSDGSTFIMSGVKSLLSTGYAITGDGVVHKPVLDISGKFTGEIIEFDGMSDVADAVGYDYDRVSLFLKKDGTVWLDARRINGMPDSYVKIFDDVKVLYPVTARGDIMVLKNDGSLWGTFSQYPHMGADLNSISSIPRSGDDWFNGWDETWNSIPAADKLELPYGPDNWGYRYNLWRYVKLADNVESLNSKSPDQILLYQTTDDKEVRAANNRDKWEISAVTSYLGVPGSISSGGGSVDTVADRMSQQWGRVRAVGYAQGDAADNATKNVTRGDMLEMLKLFVSQKMSGNEAYMNKLNGLIDGAPAEVLTQTQIADILTRFSSTVLAPLPPAYPTLAAGVPRRVFDTDTVPITDHDNTLDLMNYAVGLTIGKSDLDGYYLEAEAPMAKAHIAIISEALARLGMEKDISGRYPGGVTMYGPTDDMVADVLDGIITPGMTKREQVKAVYDFMVYNFVHTETPALLDNLTDGLDYFVAYPESVLGSRLLVSGVGTCDNFANTFKLFMNRLAIPCNYVSGQYVNSDGSRTGHGWNQVHLDGEWFWLDPDVECSVFASSGRMEPSYFLFLKKDDYWKTNHAWNDGVWPECK